MSDTHRCPPRPAAMFAIAVAVVVCASTGLRAQDRFLGKEDILLYGFGLRVEPDHQVVPKDIATIVSTFLSAPTPPGELKPFAPDATVRGTLRGPGVAQAGQELTAAPNTPFNIPPLSIAGTYTLEDIRLESGGQVLMHGSPESVTIDVIDKLLVTQVTARALSAQEIRDKGIVFDSSNFQAYNFTAAFAVQDTPVNISFPVVLPTLHGAQDVSLSASDISTLQPPRLPDLKTIIPDTLKLQTQIPNLQVVGFTLSVPQLQGKQLVVPPIPGVVVIPGDIGFLNQFFAVDLLVGNVAPQGSNLVVSDLTGSILLPAGNDTVVGSDDDPLRMARTANGESPRVQQVKQPGLDGKLGTADDIPTLGPGESGSAEYLVEGRREGSFPIEFEIAGTLNGLPGGPVQVTGRAIGSVLVRNPDFTLTFTHPQTVQAGEPYTLDVTVTNTSSSPANFVSVNLFSQNVTGATVVGDPSRQIESIPAGDSETVTFDLIARVTGTVTAATLDSDANVQGRFSLKSGVGELGVPTSPASLVLPGEASGLPANVRTAMLGLLGKAWAVATAPAAALPKDVTRFSKQIVYDRAIQGAEAGMRISLHEPVPDSVAQLEMDFIGSDYARLSTLHPDPADLQFTQQDFTAFDELRRRSVRGDVFASAVAATLAPALTSAGAAAFHQSFAQKIAYRPATVSVLAMAQPGQRLPATVTLVDAQGRRLGGADAAGKIVKEIPFADVLPFTDDTGTVFAELFILAVPAAGDYHLQLTPLAGADPNAGIDVSIVAPAADGSLHHAVYSGVTAGSTVTPAFTAGDPYRVILDVPVPGAPPSATLTPTLSTLAYPAPHLISAVQQADKDLTPSGIELGRVVAVLFSEEVTPASVQDRLASTLITNYTLQDNAVVGVALQPGRRVAFLGLRDPVGPFVPRTITVSGVSDSRGTPMAAETVPIEATVDQPAAVVSGRVLKADGTAVPFASVRLFVFDPLFGPIGVSSKNADANGAYSWDWVPNTHRNRVTAVNTATDESRAIDFTTQRNGQRLNVNVVFLGRGTVKGRTLAEGGTPLSSTEIKVTSLTDQSSYGARSDALGQFAISGIPVGNILIEAVNTAANAHVSISELIPASGATVVRDLTLFAESSPTITTKFGTVSGHVLRADGASPVGDVPVIAYYVSGSQSGIKCPGDPAPSECAVAAARTDVTGAFLLDHVSAGQIHLVTFEQASLQQGEARIVLPGDGSVSANVLLAQGVGTVNGTVLDASGTPVAGARVGGGLTLTTSDAAGQFTLTDVPVGHREIVAVSDQLAARGTAVVDILQAGQAVNVTVVLAATATIAGTVFQADGVTPVANNAVYLFYPTEAGINVAQNTVTDAAGHYRFTQVPVKHPEDGGYGYSVSAFRSDFSDGSVKFVVPKFNAQVVRADLVFRGTGGHVRGTVVGADGVTPLVAAVGISGDRPLIAGNVVGMGFQHVDNYAIVNTDIATGSFGFDGVLVGPITVTAVGQFSPDPIGTETAIPSPNATVQVTLKLQATSKIQGTVLQSDGVTPVGANVIVRYKSAAFKQVCAGDAPLTIGTIHIDARSCADVPQGIQEETVITDGSGHYELPLVTAGPFTLTAEDASTGKSGQTVGSIRAGQTGDFAVRLLGVSTLRINVRGSDSTTPIPGARVEVTQLAYPKKSIVAFADATGTLVLSGADAFSEGDVVVLATDQRNGFAGRATGRVTTDGGSVTIPVYLFNAAGSVGGFVYKPDGLTPVPNAEVVISNVAGPLAFAVTDDTGAYHQDQIPLGAFTIDVFEAATAQRGYASGRIDFDKQDVPLNIAEAGRGLVTGTALAANSLAPLKNWQVYLQPFAPNGRPLPRLQTTSDVDGTFAFPGVSVGSFTLQISRVVFNPGEPYGEGRANGAVANDGQHVDVPVIVDVVEQKFGRVDGVVLNPDGTPAANVAVDLCPSATCISFLSGGHLGAVTAADGTFAFDHVLVGRFGVTAKSQTSANAASADGALLFENDDARVTLTLVGLSQVSGVVLRNGQPAANVQVTLSGRPSGGCSAGYSTDCTAFTDASGNFSFINVPARTFQVTATDPVTGFVGVGSGTLNAGDRTSITIVLQPTVSVSGRVLHSNGSVAPGITAELNQTSFGSNVDLFAVTDANGLFNFPAVPNGFFALDLQDPLGPGVAHRTFQVGTPVAVGDVVLDEAPPAVASVAPSPSSIGVPRNATVQIVLTEPVNAATQANVSVAGPAGPVVGTLQIANSTTLVFTPLNLLAEQTRYTVSVTGLVDTVGKAMTPFSSSFTTVDLTPPALAEASPAPGTSGVPEASAIRLAYSEPLDVTKLTAAPIVVTTGGTAIAGRTDVILGNTTLVFTPSVPLTADTQYQVQAQPVTDLSGNVQPQPTAFTFRTLDRTPPQVTALRAAGNGSVIENGTTQIVADVGTSQDIAVVDFFINDQPTTAARTAPFTLNFQAIPALGHPGDRIKISALATDTSGNRSATPAVVFVPIVADAPPTVTVQSPANGVTARNGDRITVTVHVTDDLGATQIAYRAQTGHPQDAASRAISPASLDRTETFAFNVAADAVPGSTITINASAVDTKGQVATASPVAITVLDATPPTITITGTTTGTRVAPGQQTSAVVSAQDLGGIASITFTTGGVLSSTVTRTVSPAQPSVVTSFPFTVPATAHAGDVLTLDATAVDAAGNSTAAARVLLPIADLTPPTVRLTAANGSTDIVPGTTATLILQADDETGVASAALTGQGAFGVSLSTQVSPPTTSGQIRFAVPVPAAAPEGAVLSVAATATDIFGNVSAPATLDLTVRSSVGVTLPASVLVAAGDTAAVPVQLSAPAPAGGVQVTLKTSNAGIAQIDAAVQFAEGETVKNATLTAFAGGNADITAAIGGVTRATTTVTVRGGIVSGTVFDPQLQPVSGAQVIVTSGSNIRTTTSDAGGHYLVEDTDGPGAQAGFSVRVSDPITGFIGAATGFLNGPHGFAHVNVVVLSAGSISGVVRTASHATVGAGVRVDLFAASDSVTPLSFVFTAADGTYEFPVVSLGTYVVEASDVNGNHGRSTSAPITASGQHVTLDVAFIGRGSIVGTLRDGAGNPVGSVPVTLMASSIFGAAPTVTGATQPDGTFRFDGVFVGSFTLQAHDPVTDLVASASASIANDQQVVTVDLRLAAWGGLQGTLFRQDGSTPVPNVTVSVSVSTATAAVYLGTKTDANGHYALTFLPLGNYMLQAQEPATHGIAIASGALSVNGAVVTQNLTFLPQGSLVVTVLDSNGAPVAGATVEGTSYQSQAADAFAAVTGADGTVLIEHVLASNSVNVSARANNLNGYLQTTLQANEVKPVTVRLQPSGSIVGTVFLPDGQTPAAGVTVACNAGCGPSAVTTNADGTYRLDGVTFGNWPLIVKDAQQRKRAIGRAPITQNGQIVTVNFTMVGLGTVTGRVLNPDNSSAPNLTVTVQSLDPDFGGFLFARTDAAGFYRAENAVVGAIAVSTGDQARGLLGEASGLLPRDGNAVNIDVLLKSSAITLPVTKTDGNAFTFDLQRDGSIATGFNGVFRSYCCGQPGGAMYLDLIAGGTPSRFTGANIGTTEDNGREVVVSQTGVAGLNVTRKILVSSNYFARYLEILTNPSAAPITVDVRVQSNTLATAIATTSSGDAVLNVSDQANPDRWVMVNTGPDGDPFNTTLNVIGTAQVGFAFSGPGAALPPSDATFGTPSSLFNQGQLNYTWANVTVQPGQTVAFMHFGVQQYNRAAAQASLDRLVQLPPEALESLSPTEIAAIQNFAVPADATSPVAPLPPMGGTITGRLLEADGTLVPASIQQIVRYHSNVIYFGRNYNGVMNATRTYTFGPNVTVPLDAFTIEATHPTTGVVSPQVTGTFASGATTAVADVTFSNTGVIRGVVKRTSGAVVSGIPVTATYAGTYGPISVTYQTANDGSYTAGGLPAGAVTLTAQLQHPQSAGGLVYLTGTSLVNVAAGQAYVRDLQIQPTGTLTGTIRSATGSVVVNAVVDIVGVVPGNTFAKLEARTDSSGSYRISDVPLGTFGVQASDPANGFVTRGSATIVQDQTSTLDLTLLAIGTVQVTAMYANGQPAANATVDVFRQAGGRTFASGGTTAANGQVTLTNIPAGTFVVRVHRPDNYGTTVDVAGTLATSGQTVAVAAVLPPFGNVSVLVTDSRGTGIANASVYALGVNSSASGTTDGTGHVLLAKLSGVSPVLVRVTDPQTGRFRDATASITTEGATASLTIVLNAFATLSGHVTRLDGTPSTNGFVQLYGSSDNFSAVVAVDAAGAYTFTGVPTGPIRLYAQDYAANRAASFVGALSQDGESVVADLLLTDIPLPSSSYMLADANGYTYGARNEGLVFGGTSFDGIESLALLSIGPAVNSSSNNSYFTGDLAASLEMNGQQLAIRNFNATYGSSYGNGNIVPQDIAGLTVTRKLYVNPSGYFVRQLEVLENPTPQPITVNVDLSGSLNGTTIEATSTGDTGFTTDDRWVVADNPTSPSTSAGAWVFAGANAAAVPGATQLSTNYNGHQYFDVSWDTVTVPAGGRAILMSFQAQGPDSAAAAAAANRLAQLPAEALVGLTAADRAAVQNFRVPPDDTTLPAPFGSVSGRVLAADGTTPVSGAQVLVTGSASPIFRPTVTVTSDGAGQYTASTLVAGAVTLQAKDSLTGTLSQIVLLSSDGQTPLTQNITFSTLGGLAGVVTYASGAPATSGSVYISGGSPAVNLTLSLARDGSYRAPVLTPGTYTVQVYLTDRSTSIDVAVVAGQVARGDIRFPARATVRATVTDSNGLPVKFANLNISTSQSGGFVFGGSTDATGVALIQGVPEGPFVLQVIGSDNVTVLATQTGVVAPSNDGQVIDVAIHTVLGTVTGHVFAGDGATGLPGIYLELYAVGSTTVVNSVTTDATGAYEFDAVSDPTGQGVTVRAHAPGGVTYDKSGTFATGPLVLDFTLPVSLVTGTLTYADGVTPVIRGSVTAAQESSSGAVQTFSATTDFSGRYAITGVGAGAFELRGESYEGGLTGRATGSLASALGAATVDVHLGPSGTVAGTVRDAAGHIVQQADVYLAGDGMDINRSRYMLSSYFDGSFEFARIPLGAFTVEACYYTTLYSCGVATGTVRVDGDRVTVAVTLPATGTVSGTVFAADGVTPLPNEYVWVIAGTDGPAGPTSQFQFADAAGHYAQTVSAGLVTAVVYDATAFQVIGVAHGTLTPGGTLTLNVTQGTASRCDQTLVSSAGFNYAIGCDGSLSQGGAADGSSAAAYESAYRLRVNGSTLSGLQGAQTELSSRQRVYGPVALAGLVATRKVFVPSTGNFARYLDTITNPTAAAVTVDVQIEGTFGGALHVVTGAAATANTYAVTQADGLTTVGGRSVGHPALAHVFSGTGATITPASGFQTLLGTSHYTWTVTIPAGQSVTLMHFAVQAAPSDSATADAEARALVSLSDPDALAGMTPAEKAQVVNFTIQQ